jgi:hypothetical protein
MQTTTDSGAATAVPQEIPGIATKARSNKLARTIAFAAGALVTPLAIGAGVAAITRSRRAGWIAGGLTAAAVAAVRWQLQRWWTDEPEYEVERRLGELEIRRYPARIEAHTRLTVPDFETAVDEGFMRLANYIFGGNDAEQELAMTTPVLTIPRASTHTVAFVMPPDRTLDSLPRPHDDRVKLVTIPARRVAVIRFRGRYTDEVMLEQTRRLHELVAAADLDTKGQPMFAGFDPPSTLPMLRRAEMWIELA